VSIVHLPDNQTLHQLYRLFSRTYLKGKTKFEELTPEFFEFISREKRSATLYFKAPVFSRNCSFYALF
jgi:hypothetical protein